MPTADDYALAIIREGQTARTTGADYLQHPVITPKGIIIGLATTLVESNLTMYANEGDPDSENFPHTAQSADENSDGLFQQRDPWWGTAAERMDPALSAAMFFSKLAAEHVDINGESYDYNSTVQTPGAWAQMVQDSEFPDRYDERMNDAGAIYDRLAAGGPPVTTPPAVDPNRPDFNEFPMWCDNNQDRGGTKVDLWLIHTQEPGDLTDDNAAVDLANFLIASGEGDDPPNPVSYHYTIRQASDGGVTVVDVVDTDQASWSVGNSNNRAINLCFAGSGVGWSREDWLTQAKAIDVAAYLCVQDCRKYGIPFTVIPGPAYGKNPPGISDHRYCTDQLHDGNTHDDVGDNFPWDVFAAAVAKYAALAAGGTTTTPPPVTDPPPVVTSPVPATEPSGDTATRGMLEQFLGPWDADTGRFTGWEQLGKNDDGSNRSLVDGVAHAIALLETLNAPGTAKAVEGVRTPPAAAKKPSAKQSATQKPPPGKA